MFYLTYNNTTIALPSPSFGDSENVNYRKIINISRGKELLISAKMGYDNLKSIRIYDYTFPFIDEPTKQQLLDFLDSSVGQIISVLDYNDFNYQGIIMNPIAEIEQPGRNNNQVTLQIQVIDDLPGSVIMIQGLNSGKMITQGYGLP